MSSFNEQFLFAIIIIILGYFLKRRRIITEKDGASLSRLVLNVTLPALIITSFIDITLEPSLFLLIIIGIVYGTLMAFIGILFFKNESQSTKGTMAMLLGGLNIGLFAYPLVYGIWGDKGIQYFGMFDVGNAVVIFGVVYIIGSYYSTEQTDLTFSHVLKRLTRSIPLMTYVIVTFLALIDFKLPSLILDVAEVISVANMPLSFLLLGIFLNFSLEKSYRLPIIKIILLRYGIGLILGIILFFTLPFNDMFRYTILLGFILPIPLAVLPFSIEFNFDHKFVGTVVNLTILISFALLWVITNIFIQT